MARRTAAERWASPRATKALVRTARSRVFAGGWLGRSTSSDWLVTPDLRRRHRRLLLASLLPIPITGIVVGLLALLLWLESRDTVVLDDTPFVVVLAAALTLVIGANVGGPLLAIRFSMVLRHRWRPSILRERGVDACTACGFIGSGDPIETTRCPECGHDSPPAPYRTAESRRRAIVGGWGGPALLLRGIRVHQFDGSADEADAILLEARVRTMKALGPRRPKLTRPWDGPPELHPLKLRRVQYALAFLVITGFMAAVVIDFASPDSDHRAFIPVGMSAVVAGLMGWYPRHVVRRWIRVLVDEHEPVERES